MRALVVYCHPRPDSFTAAVRDRVLDKLAGVGAEVRVQDLYAMGFDPVMGGQEHREYEDEAINQKPVAGECADLIWCDTLIFVYPTWWYGLPAMIKGWLDRVLVPGLAFLMPDEANSNIRPGLGHITRLGVFTTCGASWWLTTMIGSPGRRTILRGVRLLCAKGCKTTFVAHYLMDSSTPESRAAHLEKIDRKLDSFLGRPQSAEAVTS